MDNQENALKKTDVGVSDDYRKVTIEYLHKIVQGDSIQTGIKSLLDSQGNLGWELISCSPFLMNATASPSSQVLFVFMRKHPK